MFIFFLVTSSQALAENNQTYAIGFGVGPYNFDDEDLNNIDNILYGSEFLEWYVLDEIGIGIRKHKFYKKASSENDEELLMVNINFTITWVFWGSSSNLKMAAYAGYGPGYVSYSNKEDQIDITEMADTASGGIFLDWGGKTWGARLGYHRVFSSFDPKDDLNSGTLNGSGNGFDVGIRLSF